VNGQNDPTTPTPQPLPGITRYGFSILKFKVFRLTHKNGIEVNFTSILMSVFGFKEPSSKELGVWLLVVELDLPRFLRPSNSHAIGPKFRADVNRAGYPDNGEYRGEAMSSKRSFRRPYRWRFDW
jgi:hypothetical protein